MLREDFLESYLQYKLEEAFIYSVTPSPEEEPYKSQYKAREIYKEVLSDDILTEKDIPLPDPAAGESYNEQQKQDMVDNMDIVALKAHIKYLLGSNYSETEETGQAIKCYNEFLQLYSRLPFSRAVNFLNCVQDCLNNLALIAINNDDDANGYRYLLKAEKLYEKVKELAKKQGDEPVSCYNTVDLYSHKLRAYNENRKLDDNLLAFYGERVRPVFRFFYQGGINLEKTENFYTLTCFYLAQLKAKQGDKDKSAYYCGVTLKRQLDSGDYEVKSINFSKKKYFEDFKTVQFL